MRFLSNGNIPHQTKDNGDLMKTAYRFVKHLATLLTIILPLQLVGIVILLISLPFVSKDKEFLPIYIRWFDNWSSFSKGQFPIGDGLAGDLPYREARGYPNWGFLQTWYRRWVWLGLRNALNYFQYKVLGLNWTEYPHQVFYYDPTTRDVGDHGVGGFKYIEIRGRDGVYYEYYYVKPYTLFGKNFCIWFRWGWKIVDPYLKPVYPISQWVLNFNPIKKFQGTL